MDVALIDDSNVSYGTMLCFKFTFNFFHFYHSNLQVQFVEIIYAIRKSYITLYYLSIFIEVSDIFKHRQDGFLVMTNVVGVTADVETIPET